MGPPAFPAMRVWASQLSGSSAWALAVILFLQRAWRLARCGGRGAHKRVGPKGSALEAMYKIKACQISSEIAPKTRTGHAFDRLQKRYSNGC
jgi:hypothetical protein